MLITKPFPKPETRTRAQIHEEFNECFVADGFNPERQQAAARALGRFDMLPANAPERIGHPRCRKSTNNMVCSCYLGMLCDDSTDVFPARQLYIP